MTSNERPVCARCQHCRTPPRPTLPRSRGLRAADALKADQEFQTRIADAESQERHDARRDRYLTRRPRFVLWCALYSAERGKLLHPDTGYQNVFVPTEVHNAPPERECGVFDPIPVNAQPSSPVLCETCAHFRTPGPYVQSRAVEELRRKHGVVVEELLSQAQEREEDAAFEEARRHAELIVEDIERWPPGLTPRYTPFCGLELAAGVIHVPQLKNRSFDCADYTPSQRFSCEGCEARKTAAEPSKTSARREIDRLEQDIQGAQAESARLRHEKYELSHVLARAAFNPYNNLSGGMASVSHLDSQQMVVESRIRSLQSDMERLEQKDDEQQGESKAREVLRIASGGSLTTPPASSDWCRRSTTFVPISLENPDQRCHHRWRLELATKDEASRIKDALTDWFGSSDKKE